MTVKTITCIGCPMGCRLTVQLVDGTVESVEGAGCAYGDVYARRECVNPTRMITSLVSVCGRKAPLSVKTSSPGPKDMIFVRLAEVHKIAVNPPVRTGHVLFCDTCGTGADIVATSEA